MTPRENSPQTARTPTRFEQACCLLPWLLWDGLEAKEYQVLQYLARSMSKETLSKVTIKDTCFKSLSTISRETLLSLSSVRRALQNLEKHDYIKKTAIPGRFLRGGPRQVQGKPVNSFAGVRYWVTPKWDAGYAAYLECLPPKPTSAPLIPSAPPSAAELAEAAEIVDAGFPTKDADHVPGAASDKDFPTGAEKKQVDKVFNYLLSHPRPRIAQHSSLRMPNARNILEGNIEAMIVEAGSADRVIEKLESLPEVTWIKIEKNSENLGGYLQACFRRGFEEARARRQQNGTRGGGAPREVVAAMLRKHIDSSITVDDLPDDLDSEAVEICRRAMNNPDIRNQFLDADPPASLFLCHLDEKIRERYRGSEDEEDVSRFVAGEVQFEGDEYNSSLLKAPRIDYDDM
jgi:IclR helix-turn-helix domain